MPDDQETLIDEAELHRQLLADLESDPELQRELQEALRQGAEDVKNGKLLSLDELKCFLAR